MYLHIKFFINFIASYNLIYFQYDIQTEKVALETQNGNKIFKISVKTLKLCPKIYG